MSTDSPNNRRPNTGGIIAGVVVILLGALFLLNALNIAPIPNLSIGTLWPLILIVIGVWRLAASRGRSRSFPVALIAIGALFLVINLEIIPGVDYDALGRFWPLILILVGVWRLAASRGRSLGLPIALIAIGALFLLIDLVFSLIGLVSVVFGEVWFWPIILIAVGILIAARAIRGGRRSDTDTRRQSDPFTPSGGSGAIIDVDVPAVNMEGVHTTAPDFVDGKADFNVVMGKAEVDFRSATLTHKPSTLEVSVVMGQAIIHAPPEWVVQLNINTTMGETKDTRPQSARNDADPDLIINGSVVMGSLHID